MAVVRVEVLEQGANADAESFEPAAPVVPVEPPVLPEVPVEPAPSPVEPAESCESFEPWEPWEPFEGTGFAASDRPAPADVSPLVPDGDAVATVEAAPAPSSWRPSPSLHAVNVSAAAEIAAATSMRVRLARVVM
ncbi:hypothetical protein [Streptomyces sp. DH24]|uniref:hypothetical protein n=1 Tax=Streptomyces sp. DH24 TaxID=3040123 RepID=UPI0030146F8E